MLNNMDKTVKSQHLQGVKILLPQLFNRIYTTFVEKYCNGLLLRKIFSCPFIKNETLLLCREWYCTFLLCLHWFRGCIGQDAGSLSAFHQGVLRYNVHVWLHACCLWIVCRAGCRYFSSRRSAFHHCYLQKASLNRTASPFWTWVPVIALLVSPRVRPWTYTVFALCHPGIRLSHLYCFLPCNSAWKEGWLENIPP